MSDSTIRQVILLGTLAIIGIIAVQSYWVMSLWNTQQEDFDRTIRIALLKTAEDMARQDSVDLQYKGLIIQKSTNSYIVNYDNVIQKDWLEYFLFQQLADQDMTMDFEYGVHDCESGEMTYGDFCSFSENPKNEQPTASLPEDKDYLNYFSVRFLGMQSQLANRMQFSIIFSAILLLAIFFFVYSMFVIMKQKRLSDMQKEFINNMTHEFKTPISTIKISADVFLSDQGIKENPRLSRYAGIIKEQNQRLNNQVEKVLQIAKMEQNTLELKKEKVDLNELLEDIVNSSELKTQKLQGTISTILTKENPVVMADRLHLSNILYNMIDNSIKYCKGKPEISIETVVDEKKIKLFIKDKGIGIPKEHLSRVFDKFYRVPTGNVHNVKGFGLGLFYVKNIVESHDWKIKIDSEADQGTTICVIMSRKQ